MLAIAITGLLQGSIALSDTIIIGILTIAASAIAGLLTAKISAAEWRGTCNEKFINIEKKFDELDRDSEEQWSEIRKVSRAASTLEGKLGIVNTIYRKDHAEG
jgi:hypothetical protein